MCPKRGLSILTILAWFCPTGVESTSLSAEGETQPEGAPEPSPLSVQSHKTRRLGKRAVLASVVAVALLILVVFSATPQPTVLFTSGTNVDTLSPGGYFARAINITQSAKLSGAYSSNASVFFYIMNSSQYAAYKDNLGRTIWSAGTSLQLQADYYYFKEFNMSQGGPVTGGFEADQATAFFLLTPAQFATLNSTGQTGSGYIYNLPPTTAGNISGSLTTGGTFYAVFYPETNNPTNIRVTASVEVVYDLPASACVLCTSGATNSFSVNVGVGKYYLLWLNPFAGAANITFSQPLEATPNRP